MRSFLVVLALSMAGCSGSAASSNHRAEGGPEKAVFLRSSLARTNDLPLDSGVLSNAVDDDTRFAFELYGQLRSHTGNLFLSPFSITTAMAMAWAGAKGNTAAEIANVFHYAEPAVTHAALGALDAAVNAETANLTMTFANAVWLRPTVHPFGAYLDTLATAYGAGVGLVDFDDPAGAAATIDAWVSDRTHAAIPQLLVPDDLTIQTIAVLTNAAYFEGHWQTKFDVTATVDDQFQRPDGSTTPIKMMRSEDTIRYAAGTGYQAAALPYAGIDGHHFEMVVLLPDGDVNGLEGSLDEVGLAAALAAMHPTLVDLELPRFEFRSRFELKDALSALGMPTPFTLSADFTGIVAEPPIHIAKVIHEGFVSVNETGTTASAATAVVLNKDGGVSFPPTPPIRLRLDRPFLVFIRHIETGSILFMGRVAEP